MLYRFNREKEIAYVSILYTLTVFAFFIGMYYLSDIDYYKSAVIGEFLLILLPALLFVEIGIIRGKKEFLRFNKISASTAVMVSFLILFSMPVFGMINNLVYFMFSRIFGAVEIYSSPVPRDLRDLIISLIVLALVPAVCEEFFFRGVLQGVFRRHGHIFSIVFTGILFSFLHLDIQRFIGIALLGSFIGYIVYRTNSLYAGMVAHFINNGLAVLVSYVFQQDNEEVVVERITKEGYSMFMTTDAATITSSIVITIISGTFFFVLLKKFIRKTDGSREIKVGLNFDRSSKGYLFLIPAIVFILIMYISQSYKIINGVESFLNIIISSFKY